MITEATFEESLQKLLRVAKEAHDNGNKLQGQEFADERGWLDEDESAEMASRRKLADELRKEVEARVDGLAARYYGEFKDWLSDGIDLFLALSAGRAVPIDPDDPETRGVDFDRTLAPDLRKAWTEMRDGRQSKTSKAWAIAVGNQLVQRYRLPPGGAGARSDADE